MEWFNNITTRAKLFLCFGVILLFMVVMMVIAYRNITNIAKSEKLLNDVFWTTTVNLAEVRAHQNYNRGGILEMMLATDKSKQNEIEQKLRSNASKIDSILTTLTQLDLDVQLQDQLKEVGDIIAAYRQTRGQEIELIKQGKTEQVQQLGAGVQEERFNKIRTMLLKMDDEERSNVNKQIASDLKATRRAFLLFVTLGVTALFLSLVIVMLLNRTIAQPLSQITSAAERIALGDLNITLTAEKRRDEVGILIQTFYHMTQSLRTMAGVAEQIAAGNLKANVKPQSEKDLLGNAFAQLIENLRRSVADISEAVTLLSSSASEILAATTQVASGTAENASAISETTTTVEEVRQAAQLSAQKAKNVSDSSQRVAQVSATGQKSVEVTVAEMRHIRDQMEAIARTIVRLSEQSQSIGGIIASVSDIADQSNLLAVNAAIEAARAGDQGKGFAVVAQEIKNLAEQSKQATTQVRNILNDVQKATSAAVMATEQGSKAVEAGVKQSVQTGESIQVLAESSSESVQAATQIVASSQQQQMGMDQIKTAMENINQAGAETAASMRQAEVAAKNLHELGQKLKGLVEQFKV
jgi:methyl-accepting chemotaxis protein